MEHDEVLFDSLAALRAAHEKASRLMAEITAVGARALKGQGRPPSLTQLENYSQALAQAQRQVAHCEDLLLGGRPTAPASEATGARPYMH